MPGPGKIQVFMSTPWELQALLYNFEINSAQLKTEHENWIRTQIGVHSGPKGVVLPPQRTRTMEAQITGLASRTGSDAWNWTLSQARAKHVSDAIWLLDASKLLVGTTFGLGEEGARLLGQPDNTEDERWRSVFVRLYDGSKIRVYGPTAIPETYVQRPSMRSFMAEFKTSSPFEPKEDKRGDAVAGFAQDLRARRDWLTVKRDEKKVSVPKTYQMWQIATFLEDGSVEFNVAKVTNKFCRVDYFWGPLTPKKACTLINGYWTLPKSKSFPPRVTMLSPADVEAWLENPYKALHDHVGDTK
jgi:hypothetical protein